MVNIKGGNGAKRASGAGGGNYNIRIRSTDSLFDVVVDDTVTVATGGQFATKMFSLHRNRIAFLHLCRTG